MSPIVPLPQIDVAVRPGTIEDIPFIDSLQRRYRDQLGFLKTSWIEAKIARGEVIVAAEGSAVGVQGSAEGETFAASSLNPEPRALNPLGYIISQDKYLKREELGLIVQLCVLPSRQRAFVGATLLKAAFERAAYGCRLFCCWCAQDIEANRFWESMGFVPLAYRAGSEKRGRVHIFWQKRIRAGDRQTNWWFPSQTGAGALRADRIVLPIPPGRRWDEEMPVILPAEGNPKLETGSPKQIRSPKPDKLALPVTPVAPVAPVTRMTGLRFGMAPPAVAASLPPKDSGERIVPRKKPKVKNDPRLVAAARELRDRWLEQVNAGEYLLEDASGAGKYDVSRIVGGVEQSRMIDLPVAEAPKLLPAPAPAPAATAKQKTARRAA